MHKIHGKRYVYKFNFDTISKYISSGSPQSSLPELQANEIPVYQQQSIPPRPPSGADVNGIKEEGEGPYHGSNTSLPVSHSPAALFNITASDTANTDPVIQSVMDTNTIPPQTASLFTAQS